MKTLEIRKDRTCSLKEKGNKTINYVFKDMSVHLAERLRLGTSVFINTDNDRVSLHNGSYYLLFMGAFNMVYLIYVDTKNNVRIVYNGDMLDAVEAVYRNVGNNTSVKILKSSNVKNYKVKAIYPDGKTEIVSLVYKNKSGQPINQVYLSLFECINYASSLYKKNKGTIFTVITSKGNEVFRVG